MKVSGREAFSPRPLGDDGRKPLLCVISDQSRSQNAAYCHFKVVVHLHTTLVEMSSQLQLQLSSRKGVFFLSFFLESQTSSQLARFIFHASNVSVSAGLRDHGDDVVPVRSLVAATLSRFGFLPASEEHSL